ncbi:MAG: alpha-hydroxy-acid oxidizing protein, partial [Acidobacteria bacterium]|nr:alpha-hydroxy-acid oxidizing protein [Acidobacteriota bacterium]
MTAHGASAFPLYRPDLERDACGIGLVADIHGHRSHDLIEHALTALARLEHRGAPPETASVDGSGILTQIPWELLIEDLPPVFARQDARRMLGAFFLPRRHAQELMALIERTLADAGWTSLTWRTVPVCFDGLDRVRDREVPAIMQIAGIAGAQIADADASLYRAQLQIEQLGVRFRADGFPVVSLSMRTVVYKGLLTPGELPAFFMDLRHAAFQSAIAIVHQRFSTNTFAQWHLAQPFHLLAHNGEISTIAGNRRWMKARLLEAGSSTLPAGLSEGVSDSCSLDAAAQALQQAGYALPHVMSRLVPPAWENEARMAEHVRAFYEYQARFSEPWDGPAAIAFSDGRLAGALVDRNGFRPARYIHTVDGRLYLGSEAGIFDIPEGAILERGRLGPGEMIVVDTERGQVFGRDAIREHLARQRPYRALVRDSTVPSPAVTAAPSAMQSDRGTLARFHRLFGYSQEELDLILRPMARDGAEAVGSMGDDTPPAVLSAFNRVLPDYFRQRFAQVTNPPMDPIREACVMSLRVLVGPAAEGYDETAPQPRRKGIDELVTAAAEGIRGGARVLVLTDRCAGPSFAPIPPLLATAAVHQGLMAQRLRMRASLVVETGEVRDPHQLATLFAYGASAVYPYLAFATIASLDEPEEALRRIERYRATLDQGLLKVCSKMGVTTFAGYCGSGLFDVLGLDRRLVELYFPGAGSPLGGFRLADLERQVVDRHARAWTMRGETASLAYPGFHSYRHGGEQHAYNPAVVKQLHRSAASNSADAYRAFNTLVDERPVTALRDLVQWRPSTPIPEDDVESADEICKRFFSAAMSIGALSPEAHEALATAMNRLGGRSNSGEGGEFPDRLARRAGVTWSGSAIKQVASARFGVTPAYLRSADELQIKIAQGSKPGEGGQLPAAKVVEHIAVLRYARPGTSLISPPVHHDIYSIEDLAQLIFDLRRFHPRARINVKLVAAAGVGIVAAGAAKAGADAILISGHDGGTGASPRASIKHAGLPWELGLAEAHQVLTHHGLRHRVALQVDGGLQRGRDVAIAAALGADEYGFGTAALVAIGCVMARQCHLDTCPVGIATQRGDLRRRFAGTPDMLIAYLRLVAADVRRIVAELGLWSVAALIGRADLLQPKMSAGAESLLDLAPLLTAAPAPRARRAPVPTWMRSSAADEFVIPEDASRERPTVFVRTVRNTDRAIGAQLAGHITERFGAAGLPPDSVTLRLDGTAGQSLGAFLVPGLDVQLRGEANDYVGKGMHGGTISIHPPNGKAGAGRSQVLAGNAVLY